MDRASRASLGQKGWASSKRAKPGREVLPGHPSHTAGTRDKLIRPALLPVTHDIRCDHPCSCRRELFVQGDIALAPDSMLLDGQQSVVARDQAFSGLRACSRNRKSRPLLSRTKSSSNFASRDATKAPLRPEPTRAMISFRRSRARDFWNRRLGHQRERCSDIICCHGFPLGCRKAWFAFKQIRGASPRRRVADWAIACRLIALSQACRLEFQKRTCEQRPRAT